MGEAKHIWNLIAQIIEWMAYLVKCQTLADEAITIRGGLHENKEVRDATSETVRAVKKTIRGAYAQSEWIVNLLVHSEMHDFVASCLGNEIGMRRMRLLGEFVRMCSAEDQKRFREWYCAQPFFEMAEGQGAFVFFLSLEGMRGGASQD